MSVREDEEGRNIHEGETLRAQLPLPSFFHFHFHFHFLSVFMSVFPSVFLFLLWFSWYVDINGRVDTLLSWIVKLKEKF